MNKISDKFRLSVKARHLAVMRPSIKLLDWLCRGNPLAVGQFKSLRGIDIFPHPEGGILLTARTRFSSVIIRDRSGRISEPANLTFPKAFLKSCRRRKLLCLVDENGQEYEAEESIPAFMQPDEASVFYCGGWVSGGEGVPEDHKGSVLASARAEIGEHTESWMIGISSPRADSLQQYEQITSAETGACDHLLTDVGLQLFSDTARAWGRESDVGAGAWSFSSAVLGQNPAVICRNLNDPDIMICVAMARDTRASGVSAASRDESSVGTTDERKVPA